MNRAKAKAMEPRKVELWVAKEVGMSILTKF